MSELPETASEDGLTHLLNRRLNRLRFGLVTLAFLWVASVVWVYFFGWKKLKVAEGSIDNLKFAMFIATYDANGDFVEPKVNMIQFLRHGYSISFNRVDYTQNGLELSGEIGNATQLWISSLALNFIARPYPYKIEDKWRNQKYPWWSPEWDIGTAQTTVGLLNPGSTTPFSVTIPNVKQTSDNIQIAVLFSGERYLYLGSRR